MSEPKKAKMSLVPLAGLERIARIFEKGLRDGRKPGDWKKMTRQDFVDARLRHIRDADMADTREDHEAAIGANTLIIMWFDDMVIAEKSTEVITRDDPRRKEAPRMCGVCGSDIPKCAATCAVCDYRRPD